MGLSQEINQKSIEPNSPNIEETFSVYPSFNKFFKNRLINKTVSCKKRCVNFWKHCEIFDVQKREMIIMIF